MKEYSSILIAGHLLKIESGIDEKNKQPVYRLYFLSKRYDKGLDMEMDTSLAVKLLPEHHELLGLYQGLVGKKVYIPVAFSVMNFNTYYRTDGDGKPLNLIEKDILK